MGVIGDGCYLVILVFGIPMRPDMPPMSLAASIGYMLFTIVALLGTG
jgi:hypothetical protein